MRSPRPSSGFAAPGPASCSAWLCQSMAASPRTEPPRAVDRSRNVLKVDGDWIMSEEPFDPTRRELLKITAATGGALAVGQILPAAEATNTVQGANGAATQAADGVTTALDVVLRVNGTEHRLTLDAHTTLLDA